jgi:HAMP domain-containing protein
MSLRWKILSGFLLLVLMLATAGLWSVYELSATRATVQSMLDDNYRSIEAANSMLAALQRLDSGSLLLLLGSSEEGQRMMDSADSSFAHQLTIASANITVPGETACLSEIRQRYTAYRSRWTELESIATSQAQLDWYSSELHQAYLRTRDAVADLEKMNSKSMYESASLLRERTRRSVMPGIIAVVAALLFTLMFHFLLNAYVLRPIMLIRRGIKEFEERGQDFTVQIPTRDELADLAGSIRQLCTNVARRKG